MSGWFSVKRGITSHPIFKGHPERLAIWLWLLDNAAWQDTPHDVNGKTITVKRGSVCASERRIAAEVGVGRQVVRTFLSRLSDEQMINPDATQGRSVITLCNWEKYQAAQPKANPAHNPRPTQDQPTKEQGNNSSVSKDTAGDVVKAVFDSGIKLLEASGKSSASSRSIIGKWVKAHGAEAVLVALGRAQREGAIEPVGYIEGCFRFQTKKDAEPKYGDRRQRPDGSWQTYQPTLGWIRSYA